MLMRAEVKDPEGTVWVADTEEDMQVIVQFERELAIPEKDARILKGCYLYIHEVEGTSEQKYYLYNWETHLDSKEGAGQAIFEPISRKDAQRFVDEQIEKNGGKPPEDCMDALEMHGFINQE